MQRKNFIKGLKLAEKKIYVFVLMYKNFMKLVILKTDCMFIKIKKQEIKN